MRGEDTLVLFSSDNGPHKEGGYDPEPSNSNGALRGIKRSLHDGGIRVPLIAWWPGRVEAAAVSGHIGYFGDLMATAADLAGVAAPDEVDSISFLPTLIGGEQREHDYLYWEFYERGGAQAVRFGDWKAVRKKSFAGPVELYDLATDIGEERDVSSEHADVAQRAAELMDAGHTPSELWKAPD